ncbi:MarR family transcriptional regulator [Sphingomonas metalli]|uniref:MarR family transcriptional regulator n=1 Tax=Sphingomonas metalli TaxID=1779358 RepID=A0A916WQX8_9SPHN|nr:MarR family winged helix-turn-helix transcriptional regulator [Sphingomonas metalli]GGB21421.1 MarR family transcriptional regulator [Sphingomonas metalli]
MTAILLPSPDLFLREDAIRGGMDLIFFTNTRYLKSADERLAAAGLGRAHHRVMYFVQRKPDITVSELHQILGITKQSYNRVAKDLIARNLMIQRVGEKDRRHRLLRLTDEGAALERTIFEELHGKVAHAYSAAGGEAVRGFWSVLQHLIGEEGRTMFGAVQRL